MSIEILEHGTSNEPPCYCKLCVRPESAIDKRIEITYNDVYNYNSDELRELYADQLTFRARSGARDYGYPIFRREDRVREEQNKRMRKIHRSVQSNIVPIDGCHGVPPDNIDAILDVMQDYDESEHVSMLYDQLIHPQVSARLVDKVWRPGSSISYDYYEDAFQHGNLAVWSALTRLRESPACDRTIRVTTCTYVSAPHKNKVSIMVHNRRHYSLPTVKRALRRGASLKFDSVGVIRDAELLTCIHEHDIEVEDGPRSTLIAFLYNNPNLDTIAEMQGVPLDLYQLANGMSLSAARRDPALRCITTMSLTNTPLPIVRTLDAAQPSGMASPCTPDDRTATPPHERLAVTPDRIEGTSASWRKDEIGFAIAAILTKSLEAVPEHLLHKVGDGGVLRIVGASLYVQE